MKASGFTVWRESWCRSLQRSLHISPLWICMCRDTRPSLWCSVGAERHRIACMVGDSDVLWPAVQLPVCDLTGTRLPEVAVTSSRTHYEDQESMLSKCHHVAGEFIEIRLFHQAPQKSVFQTGVKSYVCAILFSSRLRGDKWPLLCANIRALKEQAHFKVYFPRQCCDTGQIKPGL